MSKRREKSPSDPKASLRKRSEVMKDFEKVVGPPRGRNQDQKPKS